MLDRETCREHILSEDYRDFIGNHVRTPFFNSLMNVHRCEQEAGFSYKCFYLPKEISDPITLPKYSYASIPNCYSPLNMQTLNEAGILPVQNYPTLQLKGRNILIGFLDSGIDYTNPVFQNLDNTTRIRAIWDQTVQTGTMPEHFSYGSEFTEEQINEALRILRLILFHPLMKQGTELTPLPLHAEAPFLKKNFSVPHLKPLSPL